MTESATNNSELAWHSLVFMHHMADPAGLMLAHVRFNLEFTLLLDLLLLLENVRVRLNSRTRAESVNIGSVLK